MNATVALLEQKKQKQEAVKANLDQIDKFLQTVNFDIRSIDEEEHSLVAVASTATVDRHNDIIDQSGWILDNFMNNPVLLAFHSGMSWSIGKVLRIGLVEEKLMFEAKFAVDENPEAAIGWKLYKGGYQRAFSVGFKPIEYELETDEDGWVDRIIFKKQELLEISAVPVPANADAITLAYKSGVINEAEADQLISIYSKQAESLTNARKLKDNKPKHQGGTKMSKELKQLIESQGEAISALKDAVEALTEKVDQKDEKAGSKSGGSANSDNGSEGAKGGDNKDGDKEEDKHYDPEDLPQDVADEVEAHVDAEVAKSMGRVE